MEHLRWMHAAHAELASLAGTDGEGIPVTSWTTVKATSGFWENFFSKAANCPASESVERIFRQ
ncbi:hypothetical protein [Edaphobacter modestus]|uniref:hypothetical protein n=1 Tax=Edaphobacter modestus TaxID=388466 RepID=UPI00102C25EC|nr:hypothetical protein [Edaphobacter modestus]